MRKFRIKALIVGPYLPSDPISIGKYTISKKEGVDGPGLPPKITVKAKDEALFIVSQDIAFDTKYCVEWEVEAVSSKVAHQSGKVDLEHLLSCLVLPASSYKYYAEIVDIEHIIESDTGPDPESMSSQPVHTLGYEPRDFTSNDKLYYEKLLTMDEPEISELLHKFYTGIKGEVLTIGEPNLIYYKILEEISHKTLKRLKKDSGNKSPNYSAILKKIGDLFVEDLPEVTRVLKIKEYANQLRALDYEQIGERILLTAQQFNLTSEVIDTLKNINKYRAKVIAHAESNGDKVKLEDQRDVREMARLFLLHYLNKFYQLQPPNYEPVKENDSWYQYNYARSDSKV